ncbi:MAG: hypothetical protein VYA17_02320, partial [Pseudomonadota bacterium]|nr:hypothetical protein [Pseudomonadota bacterium]
MYTSFNYPIKRIIGGRTFNTEVSTEIAGFDSHDEHFGYSNKTALFKTRKGAYFLGSFQEYHEDEPLSIIPLTPERAKI